MNELLEKAVVEFIRARPKQYAGKDVHEAMRTAVDATIVNLVNRGILEVALNWTLSVKRNYNG